jgi:antitoxin component YwqK of YwqJK toxin-antitoxin module
MNSSEPQLRKRFDEEGRLVEETELRDGIPHGISQLWSSSGQLVGKAEYRDGKLHGEALLWNEAGVLVCRAHYAEGELHGQYESWWGDGRRKEDGMYKGGVRVAPYIWYDESGNVVQRL